MTSFMKCRNSSTSAGLCLLKSYLIKRILQAWTLKHFFENHSRNIISSLVFHFGS